jgi:hypothetical protein
MLCKTRDYMNVACWGFEPGSENNLTGLVVRVLPPAVRHAGAFLVTRQQGTAEQQCWAGPGWHMMGVGFPAQ